MKIPDFVRDGVKIEHTPPYGLEINGKVMAFLAYTEPSSPQKHIAISVDLYEGA